MKAKDLPEYYKKYTMTLTDKSKYVVTGNQKREVLEAEEQFFELEDGTTINKTYIISFNFEKDTTTDYFRSLPEPEQKAVVSSIEQS